MDPGIYYTLITKDNIDRIVVLIDYIKENILPKTNNLFNIRFRDGYPNKSLLINRYLVLSVEWPSDFMLSVWKPHPSQSCTTTHCIDSQSMLQYFYKILYKKCQENVALNRTTYQLLYDLKLFVGALLCVPEKLINNKNHENQLQRKETVGEFRSNRNGTPIRHSGYKLTVAIGHLSNAKRTCKVR